MAKNMRRIASLFFISVSLIMSGCQKKDPDTSSSGNPDITSTTPDPSSNNIPPSSSSSTHIPTDDVWKVTFDYNYETGFKTYLVEEVKDGNKVSRPEDPKRLGYDFVDWFSDPYCRLDRKWNFDNQITKDTTIYASWERNDDPIEITSYTISYQAGLGANFVSVDGNALKYTAEYGDVVQFKIEVDTQNYEGTPIVMANGVEINDKNGVYSYSVTGNVTFTISGLVKIDAGSYYIYFENLNNWPTVNIYIWNSLITDESASAEKVTWPGEEMIYDSNVGMMMYEIESIDDFEYNKVIFNSGDGGAQTSDLDLIVSYQTGATIYYGETSDIQYEAFDLKSDESTIVWNESSDYRFVSTDDATLPTKVKKGTSISFKLDILLENYVDNIKVLVNQEELIATGGVYTFVVNALRVQVKVTGLVKAGVIDVYYTIPSWTPEITNPKLYYWGTDASGNEITNTIDWGNSDDTQGSMQHISGNDYKMTIALDNGLEITGLIVVMYQSGEKKQSQDIETSIKEAGEYQITFVNNWVENSFGEWVFGATISKRG